MELFTNMDDDIYEYCMKHDKENPFKRYMDFLYEIHELSEEETQVYSGIGREFLQFFETTNLPRKSTRCQFCLDSTMKVM